MKKIIVIIICVLALSFVSGCADEKGSVQTYKYAIEVDGITYYANTVEEIEEIVPANAENGNTVEEIGKISPEETEKENAISVEDNSIEEINRKDYNISVYDDDIANIVFAYADKEGYHFYIYNKTSEIFTIYAEYICINGGEKIEDENFSVYNDVIPGEDGEFCFEAPYSGENIETLTGKFLLCDFNGYHLGYAFFKDVELN